MLDQHGSIDIRGYPLPNVNEFGYKDPPRGSVLVQMLVGRLNQGIPRPSQAGLVDFDDSMMYRLASLSEEERATVDAAVEINERVLREIDRKLRAAGIPWVLVPAPTKCEYSPNCDNENTIQRTDSFDVLAASAARVGIPVVDTLPSLDGSAFWERDGHWNPGGHERIAARIASA